MIRELAVKKLKQYMLNPGRFSILLLGKRGTGKTHWIHELFNTQKDNNTEFFKKLVSISPGMIQESTTTFWENRFKEAHMGTLVLEDVDALSEKDQDLLFWGLSTGPGATYGFDEKKYQFRLIFTSTKDIKTLRDSEKHLQHRFFDRISQLVVQLPSYQDDASSIKQDFKASWNKMEFGQIPDLLYDKIGVWLTKNHRIIHGHFRDLDKLAINCHQLMLMNLPESQILEQLIEEFKRHFHYPEHSAEPYDQFYINPEESWPDNLSQFRRHFKEWLEHKYGSLKKIPASVGVSPRTVERW